MKDVALVLLQLLFNNTLKHLNANLPAAFSHLQVLHKYGTKYNKYKIIGQTLTLWVVYSSPDLCKFDTTILLD